MVSPTAIESRDLYTVGWIAALPIELAAAAAMLDEEHSTPLDFEKHSTDQNTYMWGRVSGHNVVIASLPAGVYGEILATTTAMSMLHSFPQIRVGLMVGIGAGISKPEQGRDIRLGDVVVSQPDGRTGGVIQYDLRKAKAGGKQELKGMLNMPPRALLTALANLQALHERKPSKVSDNLKEMLSKNPQMARSKPGKASYVHQGLTHDRLFKAEYQHVGSFDCKDCDSHQEVCREDRTSNEPEIHYGIIASGNTLVKDAALRDKILEETREDCICLEMEAAGLMNNFPCLVIRGICDYADSHKNDRWQRYAAATAAAYAKEFLESVPTDDLEKTPKAIDTLKEGQLLS
jgi:nucleoside phosphorylase